MMKTKACVAPNYKLLHPSNLLKQQQQQRRRKQQNGSTDAERTESGSDLSYNMKDGNSTDSQQDGSERSEDSLSNADNKIEH